MGNLSEEEIKARNMARAYGIYPPKVILEKWNKFVAGDTIEIPNKKTELVYDDGDVLIMEKILHSDKGYVPLIQKVEMVGDNANTKSISKNLTKFFRNVFVSNTKRLTVPGEALVFTIYGRVDDGKK